MVGQEVWPETYHPLADMRGRADAAKILADMRRGMEQAALALPMHLQYIERYCRARGPA